MCESSHFPKLQSAKFEPLTGDGEVEVSYRSGASFKGQVEGHRKKGRGIFTWPNGDRYEGDYLDNEREGQGTAMAAMSGLTKRHTRGDFSKTVVMVMEHTHGLMAHLSVEGFIWIARRGLYHEDERAGPGVLTYSDGCQDVGLWRGEKLVKICSPITGAFTMSEHKDFDYNPAEHVYYLDKEGPSSQEVFHSTLTEPVVLYTPDNRVTEKVSSIFNIALDPRSLAVNKEAFDREFYLESEKETNISSEKVRLWNRTPSVIALQRHFCKHEYGKKSVTCNVDSIICGDRSKFKSKGPLESASEELIQAATDGNVNKVEDLLTSNKVSPDVADSNGHTALIGASYNIAERYLEEPKEKKMKHKEEKSKGHKQEQQQHQQTSQAPATPRGILSKKNSTSQGKTVSQKDNESGETEKQKKNIQNVKQQVRIEENVNNNQDSTVILSNGQGDGEEFDSNLSMKYYQIEVSEQLIERCATQLSMNEKVRMKHTLDLLLKRGADPNASGVPMPVLFFAIKAADVSMEGVAILELLLAAGADPDVRAEVDDAFLDRTLNITRVVNLLLQHGANTSLLCNGFSPLALCIASGNDMAIDELLVFGKDVSLPLTHGIDKLVRARANVLAPIAIGPKRNLGTVVDYAYYMFNQDTHIAKTPYHALTHAERETFINRKKLLEHIGDIMRDKAVEREKRRLDDEERVGIRSASPSSGFVYIGAGAQLPPDAKKPRSLRAQPQPAPVESPMVKFEGPQRGSTPKELAEQEGHRGARKPLFKYCYQCGRSVFIRLAACTRCKEVYYCSKVCKLKAWNLRHKEECIRVGGRSRSPSPRQRCDSPTPATHPDKGRRTTVAELSKDKHGQRAQAAHKALILSAKAVKKDVPLTTEDGRYLDNYSFDTFTFVCYLCLFVFTFVMIGLHNLDNHY
ncbi:ANMY1-like protein, partial [Mya arenaria]